MKGARSLQTFWQNLASRMQHGPIVKLLQFLLFSAVILYLADRLGAIGWRNVMASLPTNPFFYLVLVAGYFVMPISELAIYRRLWDHDLKGAMPAFLRKKVLNEAVVGYSGEAYLFLWARKALGMEGRQAFSTIKDNNLLSAAVSTTTAVLLVIFFMFTDYFEVVFKASPDNSTSLIVMLCISALMVPIIFRFRRKLMSLPPEMIRRVLTIHILRLLTVELLQIVLWSIALPDVPVITWVAFAAAQMVLTRVPMLPNKELMLLGLGVTLATYVDAPSAAVAGMFFAAGALLQIFNVLAFTASSIAGARVKPEPLLIEAPAETPKEA